jgi:hypothetical protein
MTIIKTIDEYFPWIIFGCTAIAETLLVIWFTTT